MPIKLILINYTYNLNTKFAVNFTSELIGAQRMPMFTSKVVFVVKPHLFTSSISKFTKQNSNTINNYKLIP